MSSTERSFTFDYDTNKFVLVDGAMQECCDMDAIQQWIHLALITQPGSADIYGITDGVTFGVSSYALLGKRNLPTDFIQSEIERQIKDTCTLNPAIESVDCFKFQRGANRTLQVSFAVHTMTDSGEVTIIYGS